MWVRISPYPVNIEIMLEKLDIKGVEALLN
jgi:hypothetical protein